ncbi:RNA polymerase II transcription factor B subunit 2 [Basidiobolus meristosporus CBS 931.73]|uniref:RNA polymerase II transcription factor B subunit 2 n=1 Tax=Basidiobolus meristosporus CBS 931.73 TaxID=1314790 RepID=A0A1Y1WPG7_9FUNG|nr:RNA polymerase II transcription factor B subunit 2 [Basidiobolus meristosporus CBS 931.73]ORX96915.1 RNA polymerase II transcription factor B subunit 2 [Basidiobolus meristosporus CBS 931.73]|eukprot:ORX75420.1 RNA polymerase II transcription factor B subunit 2 [Basidiobolus meristosporus CBS 931.73]
MTHFKTNVYEYLETLPTQTFNRLFLKPATCLSIFRLLPSLAKQFVMAMLYVEEPISLQDFNGWCYTEAATKQKESLEKLSKLHILTEKEGLLYMSDTFREHFRNALTGGGNHQSFGLLSATPDKHKVDISFLDTYATQQWEAILHYMVGTSDTKKPSKGVLNLLRRSGLMALSGDGQSNMKISNKGFQFLLQDVNTQVWAFLLQYLDMAEKLQMDLVEVLNFFFQLGSLELGKDYSTETLTPTQVQMLEDLRDYGIVYQRKVRSRRFYPTRLATSLTAGNASFNKKKSDQETETGFIILETNYRLYAYTESPLQIAVLNLFVHLKCRFKNMVTGALTRDSVRAALVNGITADQIIAYLSTHAHPQMRKQVPLLPVTVVDQIRLWEMERNRVAGTNGYLYQQFVRQQDYDVVYRYANEIGVVLWANSRKRLMAVTSDGHIQVKAYIKRRMSKGNPGNDNE